MDDNNAGPSPDEKALLARLNALKPSTVSFDPNPGPTSSSGSSSAQVPTPSPSLTARFRNLHVRPSGQCAHAPPLLQPAPDSPPPPHDASPPSPTLEELLAELETDGPYLLQTSHVAEANALLQEARRALPAATAEPSKEIGQVEAETDQAHSGAGGGVGAHPEMGRGGRDEEDDAEAASSLQRILDELDLQESQSPTHRDPSTPTSPQQTSFILPSPPKSLPTSPSPSPFSYPSTPTAPPSSTTSTPATARVSTPSASSAYTYTYTDAEISSWCAICCADAAVRCRGCAGELYCWSCWREGHVGEDVGREERGHRWEKVADMRRGGS